MTGNLKRNHPARKKADFSSQEKKTSTCFNSQEIKNSVVTKRNQVEVSSSWIATDSEAENDEMKSDEKEPDTKKALMNENNEKYQLNNDENIKQSKRRSLRRPYDFVRQRKSRKPIEEENDWKEALGSSDELDEKKNESMEDDIDDKNIFDENDDNSHRQMPNSKSTHLVNKNDNEDHEDDEENKVKINQERRSKIRPTRNFPEESSQGSHLDFEPLRATMPSNHKAVTVKLIVSSQNKTELLHGRRKIKPNVVSKIRSSTGKPEGRVLPSRTRAPPDKLDTSPMLYTTHTVSSSKDKKSNLRASSTTNQIKNEISSGRGNRGRGAQPNSSSRGIPLHVVGNNDNATNGSAIPKAIVPETRRSRRRNGQPDVSGYIGDDGNLFFCHFCNEVGEVVCCDGCPKVFHPTCVPKGPSRTSLDNDDDPWYCPTCFKGKAQQEIKKSKIVEKSAKNKGNENSGKGSKVVIKKESLPEKSVTPLTPSNVRRTRERRVKQKCSECQKAGGNLIKCKYCTVTLHFPSCALAYETNVKMEGLNSNTDGENSLICTNCRAEYVLENEEEERCAVAEWHKSQETKPAKLVKGEKTGKKRKRPSNPDITSPLNVSTGCHEEKIDKSEHEKGKKASNKTRLIEVDDSSVPLEKAENNRKTKKGKASVLSKKSKINEKKKSEAVPNSNTDSKREGKAVTKPGTKNTKQSPHSTSRSSSRPVKLIPSFFFYLLDMRPKLEKALNRKIPNFRNIPKSIERNHMVAKEGALWWKQLSNWEKKIWEYRAAKDFEERVIEWKENNIIQQMRADSANGSDDESNGEDETILSDCEWYNDGEVKSNRLESKTSDFRSTLQLSRDSIKNATTIPSSPKQTSFSPHLANTTLLDLLQDVRFHPVPKVHPHRIRDDFNFPDFSKMTIPHFDVQGPIHTYIGDECLGCTRGWCHYCPVLKRQFPAVEHRSKLQPPLSSLGAARIGFGLNAPKNGKNGGSQDHMKDNNDLEESLPLSQPSSRIDDITKFIEEAIRIKIMEKNSLPSKNERLGKDRGGYLNHEKKLNECGECGESTYSNLGCISCRRMLLIKKISNHQPVQENTTSCAAGLLKMRTVMLGRTPLKGCNFEKQREGDKRISTSLASRNWKPNVVMPNNNLICSPSSSNHRQKNSDNNALEKSKRTEKNTDHKSNAIVDPVSGHVEIKRPRVTILDRSSASATNQTNKETPARRVSRRQTSTFVYGSLCTTSNYLKDCPDVQELAEAHKTEANNLQKKCLSYAIAGVLLGLMRRDPLRLFAEPVPPSVENYHKLVACPIDFQTIRQKSLNGDYATLGAFISEVKLLCNNAIAFNPPGSIYSNTAKEMSSLIDIMQKRASKWLSVIKNTHASAFMKLRCGMIGGGIDEESNDLEGCVNSTGNELHPDLDPFHTLRKTWPDAVYLLENGSILLSQIRTDLCRTKENEGAYYGSIALRRVAAAAAASIGPIDESTTTIYKSCLSRNAEEDEELRRRIDAEVSKYTDPITLLDEPGWREKNLIQLLRRVQSRRVEGRIACESGCARCDGASIKEEAKLVVKAEAMQLTKEKKSSNDTSRNNNPENLYNTHRIAHSRLELSTGLGSKAALAHMNKGTVDTANVSFAGSGAEGILKSVSVSGSRIHGWGLFADSSFNKGDVVAEYVGEYIQNPLADKREKMYQERRIQDYQFRVADNLVIDATLRGGFARYINHSCNPNCIAKIIDGDPPNVHLKRVLIVSRRRILAREEITYDYQFPLELDLGARIPCNCGSYDCRSFMNWDLPEKDSHRVSSMVGAVSKE